MLREIKIINRENDINEVGNIRFIKKEELEKIIELQTKVMEWLSDKDLYSPPKEEEYYNLLNGENKRGKLIGCFNEEGSLIAMGSYCYHGKDGHNYGYDIEIEGDELLEIAQIEATVVHKDYRGNKLQGIICEVMEELAIEDGFKILMATASPDNPYSLNTFLKNGFKIEKEKLKYGGLKRAILRKDINK